MHHLLHKISIAALLLANGADVGTSWHQREANPLLASGGQFATRGVTIKSSVVAGLLLAQHYRHREKESTITNFAVAGVIGAVAAHNMEVRKGK